MNIYRPRNFDPHTKDYDVLFFIHGGGYFFGSTNSSIFGPRYFMENGSAILVMPQYRLGALGFLSTGDSAAPGNFGLKDQAMALQWVVDNIKAFGGNPQSITVAGQSTGASSVHMMQMSPLTRDLIKGVIALSGTALAPWNTPTLNPIEMARNQSMMLNITDFETLSTTHLVEKLRAIPPEIIVGTNFQLKWFGNDPVTIYRPVIEPPGPGAFLTESSYSLIRQGRMVPVPTLFTVVKNERAFRAVALTRDRMQTELLNGDPLRVLPTLMEYDNRQSDFTERALNRYHQMEGVKVNKRSFGLEQALTDRFFFHPIYRTLQIQKKNFPETPIYFNIFNYRGEFSYTYLYRGTRNDDLGVIHQDDLIYLFHSPALFPRELNAADKGVSQVYVRQILEFVLTQKPTVGLECKTMSPMCIHLEFIKDPAAGFLRGIVKNDFEVDMVQFWDGLNEIPM